MVFIASGMGGGTGTGASCNCKSCERNEYFDCWSNHITFRL